MRGQSLPLSFYLQDVLTVAPALLGKAICMPAGSGVKQWMITETEAYRGGDDLACHASRGRTNRTRVMFERGGYIYMYLVYGMHWMLNVVTGAVDEPQAVLIRGVKGHDGPGKLTRALGLNGSFYGEDLTGSERIWIGEAEAGPSQGLNADGKGEVEYLTRPRIGIDYAGEYWKNVPWRYVMVQK